MVIYSGKITFLTSNSINVNSSVFTNKYQIKNTSFKVEIKEKHYNLYSFMVYGEKDSNYSISITENKGKKILKFGSVIFQYLNVGESQEFFFDTTLEENKKIILTFWNKNIQKNIDIKLDYLNKSINVNNNPILVSIYNSSSFYSIYLMPKKSIINNFFINFLCFI